MAEYVWSSIEEIFNMLHEAECEYVILRNYEEIDAENFYTSGHADIDFLVGNKRYFTNLLHVYPRFVSDDGIHYLVNIRGTEVVLDVRSVGDGYYDRKWEKRILRDRVLLDNRFCIPDKENYYYSLVYHAVLQKKELSEEYLQRLNQMAVECGVLAESQEAHLKNLEEFMTARGYDYTVPYDIWVPLRTEYINRGRIKKEIPVYIRDIKTAVLQFGSKVKHKIIGR